MRRSRQAIAATLVAAFILSGCSSMRRSAMGGTYDPPPIPQPSGDSDDAFASVITDRTARSIAGISGGQLLLFGGSDHKVFLGCLNCNQYSSGSVFNEYGTHGSPYSTESIFNHFGSYGSKYSGESACSPYASDPPVIVDGDGRYYGRLTLNNYHPQIGIGRRYVEWLSGICDR